MKAFKSYDIRGIYGRDFGPEDAYKIGFFLPALLKADKVLVGRDVRVSSPEIFAQLSRGITDAGADVYDLGLATTPLVYYMTAKHGFDASVQITASHNPKQYNGMKISRANALPVGYDSGLAELERLVENDTPEPVKNTGKIIAFDRRAEYMIFLKRYLPDFSNLRVAIDCSNGMAALLAKELFGAAPIYLNDELDGSFPNHSPNPLEEEDREQLRHAVLSENCDLGMIFDGDADRVVFVDENGRMIWPDLMIGVLGEHLLKQNGPGKVLQDIRSSRGIGEFLEPLGAEMHTWKVGRAHAALKLREIDGLFGGEFAGHYYFRDFFYSDSAMLAAMVALSVFSENKRTRVMPSQVAAKVSPYLSTGELNYTLNQKQKAIDTLRAHFEAQETPTQVLDFDGVRLDFQDWWFNVRPSNTEPYLRFIGEFASAALRDQKMAQVERIMAELVEQEAPEPEE